MSRIDDLIDQLCPQGVRSASLGELGVIFGGLTGKSKVDFSNGNARYVSYVNVYNNLAVNLGADDLVRVEPGERQRALVQGDILFTGSSETPYDVGMSSVVTAEVFEPHYLNSFCIGFRLNDPRILDPEFAKYLFRSTSLREQIRRTASGVTRFNISKARLAKVDIPLPPLEVQREIVRVLDLFTQLETDLEAELEAEMEGRRAQYSHYRKWLLTLPEESGVRWSTLGHVALNLDSRRKPVTKSARVPGSIPYYGASGIVDYVSDYIFNGDYLLVSEDGANLLARSTPIAFTASGKTWINNHAHVLEFSSYVERRFIEIYLNSIDLAPYVSGSTQPKLNQANLNRIPVPQPGLAEQERIVGILDKLDGLINLLYVELPAELNARRQQYGYYSDRMLTFKESVA